ncbi:MAG: archease [Deltaproteobacteria bacterium]|nr:MAG: archease [Deltaproteobacteria bacterium]
MISRRRTYQVFEHTADVGIEAYGETLEELFAHAAVGLIDLMTDPAAIEERERVTIEVEGQDLPQLLRRWLSEILFLFDAREILLSRFEITISPEHDTLHAVAYGEPFEPERHPLENEVKAVTYHGLEIRGTGPYRARVVFDI